MSSEFRHPISLALNVILTVTAVLMFPHKSEHATTTSARMVGSESAASRETTKNDMPAFTREPELPRYVDIQSASDRRRLIVDQLRAMGVPNSMLAQFVQADRDTHWEDYFWKESRGADPDKMSAMQLEHDMAKDAEMRAALGEEGFKRWDGKNMLKEAMSGKVQLTEVESDAIYDLKKKMQKRQLELEKARLDGTMDDSEINDASYKAYSEFQNQLKTLLGEDRFAKSQRMDEGSAVANLQHELAKVDPSDSQLKELLKAQQQWDARRSELDKKFEDNQGSPAYAEQIKALEQEQEQEYRRVLGTNVFDTFRKEQDAAYSTMKKYETLWGLDNGKIDYVYSTLKYFEKSVEDYQAQARALEAKGQIVDWDAANKNLQQFADQTRQALQHYLGNDSFDKLQRNGVVQLNPTQPSSPGP
jgi:hypothetical protein